MGNLLISESLLGNDVFAALRRIEIHWQLDSLRLIDSQGEIGLLLEVLETEALQVLFSERLRVEDAGRGNLGASVVGGARLCAARFRLGIQFL